jgi:ABC-type Mn2+/Zn2+ transport system permease subunit
MTDLTSTWELFFPQLILGSLSGALLSLLGILIVLRRMTFFGLTLSQGVSFSVAVCLFLQWTGEGWTILLSLLFTIPLVLVRNKVKNSEEVVLGIFFLFFSAVSQFLLALGGNVQNHLMASYFGDILTSQVKLNSLGVYASVFALFLYGFFFQRFLFISFDPEQYKIQKGNPLFFDLLYYAILAVAITVAVNLFGSFFSMSHMIIPVFTLLPWFSSIKKLAIAVVILSVFGTLLGFYFSLFGFRWRGEEIFFPTSSTIILVLCFCSLMLFGLRKIWTLSRR